MFYLLSKLSLSVEYTLAATELIISGTGAITKEGVLSKGSVSQVTNVIINEGPTEIGESAFNSVEQLVSINIPKSVTKIDQPFNNLGNLLKIEVHPDNPNYCNDKNFILYTKSKDVLIKAPVVKNIEIPDGVVSIFRYAFLSKGFNYGDIVFPASLVTLNSNSFWDSCFDSISFKSGAKITNLLGFKWCKVHNRIIIPKSVTSISPLGFEDARIASFVFEDGSKLQTIEKNTFYHLVCSEISLPDNLKTIGDFAFKESKLEEINIGSQCSSISTTAFAGCTMLRNINISFLLTKQV